MGTIALKIDKLNETKEKLKQELLFKGFTEEEIGPEFSKMANCIKTIGNANLPQWFKDSIVCWYDPKRLRMTNEEMLALKEAGKPLKLIDFSGNGLDMDLKNFAWSGMSGVGGYNIDPFTAWLKNEGIETTSNIIKIILAEACHGSFIFTYNVNINFFKFKITGLKDSDNLSFGKSDIKIIKLHNGINYIKDFPKCQAIGFLNNNKTILKVTIEILPEYPNALVFDGVDDFASPIYLPNLGEEFTVLGKYKILKAALGLGDNSYNLYFRDSASYLRLHTLYIDSKFYFRGYTKNVIFSDNSFDSILRSGQRSFYFSINGYYKLDTLSQEELCSMAFCNCLIFNKELTPEQIEWVKTNISDPIDKLEFQSEYQNN